MEEILFKGMEYQELVKELVYENMENCERLAKAMKVLNWRWAGSFTACTGGLVLRWSWNTKTFELYDFEIMFDIWKYLEVMRLN